MPLFSAQTNAVATVKRDRQEGGGGSNTPVIILQGARVSVAEENEFDRTVDGRVRTVRGIVVFPAHQNCVVTDLQGGDTVEYVDYRGVTQTREIVTVRPRYLFNKVCEVVAEVE